MAATATPPGPTTASPRSAEEEPKRASEPPRRQVLLRRAASALLALPWLVGLAWTALHPIASVITGELKCRGQYVDENGLDVHRHRVAGYPLERMTAAVAVAVDRGGTTTGMCDAVRRLSTAAAAPSSSRISPSVECIVHAATDAISFDVVRILPPMGPVIESTEAVVLVVGGGRGRKRTRKSGGGDDDDDDVRYGSWYGWSDLNASVLHMIARLGNREDCPWLNKAVIVVSPSTPVVGGAAPRRRTGTANATDPADAPSLADVVDAFVASYLGGVNVRSLPPDFTFATMRSLLVLSDVDVDDGTAGPPPSSPPGGVPRTEVRILPHGAGGALPNLDLVFATYASFQSHPVGNLDRSRSIYYGGNSDFRTHPYGGALEERVGNVLRRFGGVLGLRDPIVAQYSRDLAGLLGFVAAMAIGPRQPHSSALNHGIDALTIEVRVPGNRDSHPASIHPYYADLTRCTEHLLRSISNLHERLHHSIAQYTMPSPSKFVSHGEYIYPAILVSLPMVVRAATLALRDLKRFEFVHVGIVLATVCMTSFAVGILAMRTNTRRSEKDFTSEFILPIAFFVSHVLVLFVASQDRLRRQKEVDKTEIQGSLRFAACLVGIYLHAPLLLANYSLGFPSSVFWSPLLATLVLPPSMHASLSASKVLSPLATFIKVMFLLVTTPPILLVPRIFYSYTVYVSCVYTPLHFLLAVLWLA